jgi:parvulin-like peptidyl-prolyl isomerase
MSSERPCSRSWVKLNLKSMEYLQYYRLIFGKDSVPVRYGLALLLVVLPVFCISCSKPQQKIDDPRLSDKRIVLQEGDHKLTLGDVEKHFSAVKFDSAGQEYDLKWRYVEQSLDRFLLIDGARALGFPGDLDSSVIKRSLMQNLYNEEIMKKINVTEGQIEDFFAKYGGEVEVGMITVNDSTLADSLYRVIKNGGDFEQLARDFSKDEISGREGGNLGYIPYGRLSDKIQDLVFSMKIGDLSAPIHIRSDWQIVKAYDHIKNTEEDLEKNKGKYRDMTNQYLQKKLVNEFVDRVRGDIHFTIVKSTIAMMIEKADSVKALGIKPTGLPSSAYLDSSLFTSNEGEMFIAQYDGGGVRVVDYIKLIRGIVPERTPELRDGAVLDEALENMTIPAVLVDKIARQKGIDQSSEFKDGLEYLRDNLLAQKMKDNIYGSLDTLSDADIIKYYNEHRDEFYRPDQVRVSAIATKTKEEGEALLQRIRGGAMLQLLAQKYSIDRQSAREGGDLGFFTVLRNTPIYKASENLKAGDLGGPVEMDGNWWIFRVTERINKSPKTFEEAGPNVTSRAADDRRAKAYHDWLANMREKSHFTMDLDLLKNNLRTGQLAQTGKDIK